MKREQLFKQQFDNDSLEICAAGFEDHCTDFVLYGKDDYEYTGDGDKSAEFMMFERDAKVLVKAFDETFDPKIDTFTPDQQSTLAVVEKGSDYILLEVTDSYGRPTVLTIFDTDARQLLRCFTE